MALGRTQLRALLSAGSSIVFDGRAREMSETNTAPSLASEAPVGESAALAAEAAPAKDEPSTMQPFFEHSLMKNCILLKTIEHASEGVQYTDDKLQTRLFFPYDAKQIGDGGVSLVYSKHFSRQTLENFFGVQGLDDSRIKNDLQKLAVFAQVPSFSPFLLRDAFERSSIKVDNRYFCITDDEANSLRDNLKTKLKPLAAMALDVAPALINGNQIEILIRKLWQLDDPKFLLPLSRALKIDDSEAIEVFYAWIGVSYFQGEFARRQPKLRDLAEWLAHNSTPTEYVQDSVLREYMNDRKQVRERLRWAWSSARAVFDRYNEAYEGLLPGKQDARPFVKFLQTVRTDFSSLGERVSVIEQCLSLYEFSVRRSRTGRVNFDFLQDVMRSMRDISCGVDVAVVAA
jgi:hypothetical protein